MTKRAQLILLVAHPYEATLGMLCGAIEEFLQQDYQIVNIALAKARSVREVLGWAEELKEGISGAPSAVAILPYTWAQETLGDDLVRNHLERLEFEVILLGTACRIESNRFSDKRVLDESDVEDMARVIATAVTAARSE